MIICSAVVFALYLYHVFPIANADPDAQNAPIYLEPLPSSVSISSVVQSPTERLLVLVPSNTSTPLPLPTHRHSNSSHHIPSNATYNSTGNPTPTRLPFPGQTIQPGSAIPPGLGNANSVPTKHPNIAQLFFEVIGGVAGAVVFLALLRCLYVYRKTPTNRSSPEVAERDRMMALLRTVPWRSPPIRPPPPPYQPAPEYSAVTDARDEQWEPEPPDRSYGPAPPEHHVVVSPV